MTVDGHAATKETLKISESCGGCSCLSLSTGASLDGDPVIDLVVRGFLMSPLVDTLKSSLVLGS